MKKIGEETRKAKETVERFEICGKGFAVVSLVNEDEDAPERYAVQKTELVLKQCGTWKAETEWLCWPEHEYETEGGARLAILLFLDESKK